MCEYSNVPFIEVYSCFLNNYYKHIISPHCLNNIPSNVMSHIILLKLLFYLNFISRKIKIIFNSIFYIDRLYI